MKTFKHDARLLTLILAVLFACNSLAPAQTRRRTRTTRQTRQSPTTRRAPATQRTTPPATPSSKAAPTPHTSNESAKPASDAGVRTGAGVANAPAAVAPVEESVAFDALLAAEGYMLYGELRAVGQQLRSGDMLKTLEPLWKLSGTPREVGALLEFLRAHEEQLNDARLMFVALPSDPQLPQTLVALELPSVEVARKFAPELNAFLSSVAPPEIEINAEGVEAKQATQASPSKRGRRTTKPARYDAEAERATRNRQPFFIKRAGNLILASTADFNPRNLKSKEAKSLAAQMHFKTARARFSGESLFLYFDYLLMTRDMQRHYDKMRDEANEAQWKKARDAQGEDGANEQYDVAVTKTADDSAAPPEDEIGPIAPVPMPVESPTPGDTSDGQTSAQGVAAGGEPTPEELARLGAGETLPGAAQEAADRESAVALSMLLGGAIFGGGGEMNMPEAISLGAGYEGDALALRVLLLNAANNTKPSIVPFLPILINGDAHAPEAASIVPASTDIYVSASLDLSQIYERFITSVKQNYEKQVEAQAAERRRAKATVNKDDSGASAPTTANEADAQASVSPSPENQEPPILTQLAAMEKLLGFKVKEDIIDALGDEVAVGIPDTYVNGPNSAVQPQPSTTSTAAPATPSTANASPDRTALASPAKPAQSEKPASPVVLISLRNKDGLQSLLPRLLLVMGFGAPTAKEKSGDIEIVSFAGGALAFVGNYLALAPDMETLRRVAVSYTQGETLAASDGFRQATSWQPKQTLGQIYVSSAFLKSTFAREMRAVEQSADDETKNFLSQFKLEPGAITHAVVNEGDGPLHEIRVARNVIDMFFAYTTVSDKHAPAMANEARAISALNLLHSVQTTYRDTVGKGRFGTLQELKAMNRDMNELFEVEDYRLELNAAGDKFEATATPTAYPDKGRRSFFVNETGIVRGGDKGGQRASATDEPVN